MNKQLQERLYSDFPLIFSGRHLSIRQSAMPFGCECDSGWEPILRQFCSWAQGMIRANKYPQVIFDQVKEKFGTLTIHWSLDENWVDSSKYRTPEQSKEAFARWLGSVGGAIQFIEYLSGYTCEICGAQGDMKYRGGWMKTCCDTCGEKCGFERLQKKDLF